VSEDRFLSDEEAADWLKRRGTPQSAKTLGKLRSVGGGPKYRKFGRKPVYTEVWLEDWVNTRLSDPDE
jgi:hypothetical protein